MGSTLSNLLYHIVFSTKNRQSNIVAGIGSELHRYIGGIVKGEGAILLEIGGIADHVHLVLKLKPVHSLSEIMRKVKGNSSKWVNEQNRLHKKFSWQDGYGAFSVSESQVNNVLQYVRNQEKHHRTISFKDEFIMLLQRHGVEYDEQYLWK
jgi:REP element-mobilizing transposase RayT